MLDFLLDSSNEAEFCGRQRWELREGILVQPGQDDFYWGEIPLPEMNHALDVARKSGWQAAVKEVVAPKWPHLVGMIESESRVDWLPLLNRQPELTLDIGSGWGQTSCLLARVPGNHVISIEQIGARTQFQSIRRQQENIENLHIINGGLMEAELEEGRFDLATFIGVLEWVGVANAPQDPREVQVNALKQVHRLLKSGGQVVVGIENRVGFNNFLGAIDHSGLRFTTLMPRRIASLSLAIRSRAYRSNRRATSYRTYTYTMQGYQKLFHDAGFDQLDIFVAHPHYADPRCLIEAKNGEVRRFFRNSYRPSGGAKDVVCTQLFSKLGLIGLAAKMAPHFILIGTKH